ncbi:MAG: ABC transporter permease subunit [bacterium]|jgi:Cu-processing system permease protein
MNKASAKTIALIARQELRIVLRNRWTAVYAAVFAALTFAISYFGLAVVEKAGFQEFDRTAVSLLNLVLYIVPLASMLLAVQSLSSEAGSTDRLFTEPVTAAEIILGKAAGLSVAHILSALAGFGFTGIFIAIKAGLFGFSAYAILVAFTIAIGVVFIALACLLSVAAGRGPRAYAAVLVAWFVSVIVFDLAVIGISLALPEGYANRTALAGVFLNPVDATRVAALLAISGKEMFGAAGALLVRSLHGAAAAVALLCAALAAWTAVSLAAASALLARQDA